MGERKVEREKLKGKIVSDEVWKAFVDNLSRRVSRRELRDIFSSHGTVERVFIPKETKNPKYRFSTFAFVQFERESSLKRAIEMLNGSLIDGRRISVGVAKYNDARPRIVAKESPGKLVPDLSTAGPLKLKEVDLSGRNVRDDRTYRDALLTEVTRVNALEHREKCSEGSHREKTKKNVLEMYIPTEGRSWVRRSLTGIIKLSLDFKSVYEFFLNNGYEVQIAGWGYARNSCAIIFKSQEEMSEAWTKKRGVIGFWFDRVAPLLNEEGVPMAFCQLELSGVPLLCWDETFLVQVAGRWGNNVEIHESTKNRDDLTSARILMRVASPFDVPDNITLGSYGRSYRVSIKVASASEDSDHFFKCSPTTGTFGKQFSETGSEEGDYRGKSDYEESSVKSAETFRQKVDLWIEKGMAFGSEGTDGEKQHLPRLTKHGKNINEGVSDGQNLGNIRGDFAGLGIRLSKSSADGPEAQSEDFELGGLEASKIIPFGPVYTINKFGKLVQNRGTAEASCVRKQCKGFSSIPGSPGSADREVNNTNSKLTAPSSELSKSLSRGRTRGVRRSSLSTKSEPLQRREMASFRRVYRRCKERNYWYGNDQKENNATEDVIGLKKANEQDHTTVLQITTTSESNLRGSEVPNSVDKAGARSLVGKSEGGVEGKHLSIYNSDPYKRRAKRILVREALEHVNIYTASSSGFSEILDEAVATWQVSQILGVSFTQGKEAFLDKIIELEKGLKEAN